MNPCASLAIAYSHSVPINLPMPYRAIREPVRVRLINLWSGVPAVPPQWASISTPSGCVSTMVNEAHARWRDRSLRDIIARMRHDGCGGLISA